MDVSFPTALEVHVTGDALTVGFSDGRTLAVPLAWYPRLLHATAEERANWRFVGQREGIHWPDVDEDVNIEGLICGRPSGESQRSFQRWLEARQASA